jgi:hypothetical protein
MQVKYTRVGQERFVLSTGEKIHPNKWDPNLQKSIVNKKLVANSSLNMWLDKMANTFKVEFRNYLMDGNIPTAIELKESVENSLNIRPVSEANAPKKRQNYLNFSTSI